MNGLDSDPPRQSWALITGGSMGLGEEFARQLAARKINLLLTARHGPLLEKIAGDLSRAAAIRVEIFTADLAHPDGIESILSWLDQLNVTPTWLINNAGFGHARPFNEIDPQRLLDCIQVNVTALTSLTRALLPAMSRLPQARLINVASTAAFQPVPYFGVYAATKAYVLSLSEALREELRDTNVRVTCLCPGPTATNFGVNNEIAPRMFHFKQSAPEVVRMALRGSDKNQAVVITQNKLTIHMQRLLPRVAVRQTAAWLLRKSLEK
jgi:uncharacterized protein